MLRQAKYYLGRLSEDPREGLHALERVTPHQFLFVHSDTLGVRTVSTITGKIGIVRLAASGIGSVHFGEHI